MAWGSGERRGCDVEDLGGGGRGGGKGKLTSQQILLHTVL